MRHFKLIYVLMLLIVLTSCSSNNDLIGVNYYSSYEEMLDDGVREYYLNSIGVDYAKDSWLKYLGSDFPVNDFKDYDGNNISLPSGKKIIFINATWCEYCKKFTKDTLPSLLDYYKDIPMYQYLGSAKTAEEVDNFYGNIEKGENITILLDNELSNILAELNLPIPITLCIDDNNKISFVMIGEYSADICIRAIDNLIDESIYNSQAKNSNLTFKEAIDFQKELNDYLNTNGDIWISKDAYNKINK